MAIRLIYGMDVETWNSLSEEEQIAIANREEYRSQHMDQLEWFVD